ncbi:AT-rich interactive domain-containing protein 2-like [Nilaparvata lugens]|uniref:AT-rich interactive domain-containing protein 2-like n=1 Tax=Nilaparvata lugens TaxID=108931 RepID=UPI00193D381C|nr:AT-rich interactive domain-containing protein 2-like [Nilaparvata lugens]
MAKILDKDPAIYERERDTFLKDLQHFHESRGTPIKRTPKINGADVDLYLLYVLITGRGGWYKVNAKNEWDLVLESFGNVPKHCVNSGVALKQIYLRYLDRYEKAHFLGDVVERTAEDEDDNSRHRPRWSAKAFHTVPLVYNHAQHNVCDSIRTSNGLDTRLYKASDYDRLALSLVSPLPNEQDFAINVCTLLSANDTSAKHHLRLHQHPRLLTFLMAHAAVFNHASTRELFTEQYEKVRGYSMRHFWTDVLEEDSELHALLDETRFVKRKKKSAIEHSCAADDVATAVGDAAAVAATTRPGGERRMRLEPDDKDLFCVGRTLGTQDRYGQRVLQIAQIARNLSFEEDNSQTLASDTTFVRFALLCCGAKWNVLRQSGLDMLTNVASDVALSDSLLDPLLAVVNKGLESQDRAAALASLELLNKLGQNESNEDLLLRCIDDKVYERICELLTLQDIMVLVHTLECLYSLTSLGERSCNAIVRVHGALDTLVSLLTVEAQSYGPKACVLMRVVETVSTSALGTTAPTPQTAVTTPTPVNLTTVHTTTTTPASPQFVVAAPQPHLVVTSQQSAITTSQPSHLVVTSQPHLVVTSQHQQVVTTGSGQHFVVASQAGGGHFVVTSQTGSTTPARFVTSQNQQNVTLVQAGSGTGAFATQRVVMPVSTTSTQQVALENEQFALNWLRQTFEAVPQGGQGGPAKVEQGELYKQYITSCAKIGRRGVIAPNHFPRCVRTVFGLNVGPKQSVVGEITVHNYEGIQPKPTATVKAILPQSQQQQTTVVMATPATTTTLPAISTSSSIVTAVNVATSIPSSSSTSSTSVHSVSCSTSPPPPSLPPPPPPPLLVSSSTSTSPPPPPLNPPPPQFSSVSTSTASVNPSSCQQFPPVSPILKAQLCAPPKPPSSGGPGGAPKREPKTKMSAHPHLSQALLGAGAATTTKTTLSSASLTTSSTLSSATLTSSSSTTLSPSTAEQSQSASTSLIKSLLANKVGDQPTGNVNQLTAGNQVTGNQVMVVTSSAANTGSAATLHYQLTTSTSGNLQLEQVTQRQQQQRMMLQQQQQQNQLTVKSAASATTGQKFIATKQVMARINGCFKQVEAVMVPVNEAKPTDNAVNNNNSITSSSDSNSEVTSTEMDPVTGTITQPTTTVAVADTRQQITGTVTSMETDSDSVTGTVTSESQVTKMEIEDSDSTTSSLTTVSKDNIRSSGVNTLPTDESSENSLSGFEGLLNGVPHHLPENDISNSKEQQIVTAKTASVINSNSQPPIVETNNQIDDSLTNNQSTIIVNQTNNQVQTISQGNNQTMNVQTVLQQTNNQNVQTVLQQTTNSNQTTIVSNPTTNTNIMLADLLERSVDRAAVEPPLLNGSLRLIKRPASVAVANDSSGAASDAKRPHLNGDAMAPPTPPTPPPSLEGVGGGEKVGVVVKMEEGTGGEEGSVSSSAANLYAALAADVVGEDELDDECQIIGQQPSQQQLQQQQQQTQVVVQQQPQQNQVLVQQQQQNQVLVQQQQQNQMLVQQQQNQVIVQQQQNQVVVQQPQQQQVVVQQQQAQQMLISQQQQQQLMGQQQGQQLIMAGTGGRILVTASGQIIPQRVAVMGQHYVVAQQQTALVQGQTQTVLVAQTAQQQGTGTKTIIILQPSAQQAAGLVQQQVQVQQVAQQTATQQVVTQQPPKVIVQRLQSPPPPLVAAQSTSTHHSAQTVTAHHAAQTVTAHHGAQTGTAQLVKVAGQQPAQSSAFVVTSVGGQQSSRTVESGVQAGTTGAVRHSGTAVATSTVVSGTSGSVAMRSHLRSVTPPFTDTSTHVIVSTSSQQQQAASVLAVTTGTPTVITSVKSAMAAASIVSSTSSSSCQSPPTLPPLVPTSSSASSISSSSSSSSATTVAVTSAAASVAMVTASTSSATVAMATSSAGNSNQQPSTTAVPQGQFLCEWRGCMRIVSTSSQQQQAASVLAVTTGTPTVITSVKSAMAAASIVSSTSSSSSSASVAMVTASTSSATVAMATSSAGNSNQQPSTTAVPQGQFLCEWRGCMRNFRSANEVYLHACAAHCPPSSGTDSLQCLWERCDTMRRKRFSLMTHLYDRHCNADVLRKMAARRRQLSASGAGSAGGGRAGAQQNGGDSSASSSSASATPPPHPGYAPNAAFHAIKRHALEFVNPKELQQKSAVVKAGPPPTPVQVEQVIQVQQQSQVRSELEKRKKDDNEGPVTKSIRLTSALILRNLVIYSTYGRRYLTSYEPHLASVALSNVESSRTIAQVLFDMSQPR